MLNMHVSSAWKTQRRPRSEIDYRFQLWDIHPYLLILFRHTHAHKHRNNMQKGGDFKATPADPNHTQSEARMPSSSSSSSAPSRLPLAASSSARLQHGKQTPTCKCSGSATNHKSPSCVDMQSGLTMQSRGM